jgi:hypothetical protein
MNYEDKLEMADRLIDVLANRCVQTASRMSQLRKLSRLVSHACKLNRTSILRGWVDGCIV